MAEEGALQEVLGERAAVDGDEGAGVAAALEVEGAGEQLLAGAVLAGDEDGEIAGGDALGERDGGEERSALPHHGGVSARVRERGLQGLHLPLQGDAGQGALHHDEEHVRIHGLGEEVIGAQADGLQRVARVPGAGDDDDLGAGAGGQQRAELLQPGGHAAIRREHQIQQDEGERAGLEGGAGGGAVRGLDELVARVAQQPAVDLAEGRVVVDEEERREGGGS